MLQFAPVRHLAEYPFPVFDRRDAFPFFKQPVEIVFIGNADHRRDLTCGDIRLGEQPLRCIEPQLRIDPYYDCGLSYVKAALMTPYGKAVSEWTKEGDTITLNVTVPPNTQAVVVTGEGEKLVGSGEWIFEIHVL